MTNSPPLPSKLRYGALTAYSSKGSSDVSVKSRDICYAIKNDHTNMIERAVRKLAESIPEEQKEFFGEKQILVPVPRSAPLQAGGLWPPEIICRHMVAEGLAAEVRCWLKRSKAIRKSSQSGRDRPSPEEHRDSLQCNKSDFLPVRITLIDDVVSRGATFVGAAAVLRQAFPKAEIRAYALVRTCNFEPEISEILDPVVGEILCDGDGRPRRIP